MLEEIKKYLEGFLEKLNLQEFSPYFQDVTYLLTFFFLISVIIFIILGLIFRNFLKNRENTAERTKPALDEIVQTKELKINDDNEFVDVLVAIEEEMAAVRELYVGGYISKGVYISETDRLYEKAKIFGL
tara:strand:+ start:93 stop:482 length:390 start_codon:yes stop_codon:yes gene_type:complete